MFWLLLIWRMQFFQTIYNSLGWCLFPCMFPLLIAIAMHIILCMIIAYLDHQPTVTNAIGNNEARTQRSSSTDQSFGSVCVEDTSKAAAAPSSLPVATHDDITLALGNLLRGGGKPRKMEKVQRTVDRMTKLCSVDLNNSYPSLQTPVSIHPKTPNPPTKACLVRYGDLSNGTQIALLTNSSKS